ncbi:MAG TPA: hypothetical protein PLQ36_00905 [Candidatus Gracilibacteria bacterium]|nr:hypothetical protein [Candidatus Gracilibacteria bacterium]
MTIHQLDNFYHTNPQQIPELTSLALKQNQYLTTTFLTGTPEAELESHLLNIRAEIETEVCNILSSHRHTFLSFQNLQTEIQSRARLVIFNYIDQQNSQSAELSLPVRTESTEEDQEAINE